MDTSKINRLDNYQLYQLLQNTLIDATTLAALKKEYASRNLSGYEQERLAQKYATNHTDVNSALEKKPLSPILTGFAYNTHFRHIAFLKSHGRKKEAKQHLLELYLGLALYFLGSIALLLYFRLK